MRLAEELLGSKNKIRLLEKLVDSSHAYSVRELARMSGLPKTTVAKIVTDWEKTGLLQTELYGQLKTVRLNPAYALLPAIRRLFQDQKQHAEKIVSLIQKDPALKSKDVICAIVYGSLGRKNIGSTSDADILLITARELKENHPASHMWDRLNEKLPISPSVAFMTKKEAEGRIERKEKFIQNVLNDGVPLKGRDWFERAKRSL